MKHLKVSTTWEASIFLQYTILIPAHLLIFVSAQSTVPASVQACHVTHHHSFYE